MNFQTTKRSKNILITFCMIAGLMSILACGTDVHPALSEFGDGYSLAQEDIDMLGATKTRNENSPPEDGRLKSVANEKSNSSASACGGGHDHQPSPEPHDLYPVLECLPFMVQFETEGGGVGWGTNPEADCGGDGLCPDGYSCHFVGDGQMPWRCCFISHYEGYPVE